MNLDKLRGGFIGILLGESYAIGSKGRIGSVSTLTVTLMWCILSDRAYIRERVILEYLAWANQPKITLKKNVRALMHGIKTISGYEYRISRTDLRFAEGNANLMRIFPMLLLSANSDVYNKILEDTNLTNPNPVSRDAALLLFLILQFAYQGNKAHNSLKIIMDRAQSHTCRNAIKEAIENKMRKIDDGMAEWSPNTLYIVCKAWLYTDYNTPIDEILQFVDEKKGDTECNCALAGAIVGLVYGESVIENHPQLKNILESNPGPYNPGIGLNMLRFCK